MEPNPSKTVPPLKLKLHKDSTKSTVVSSSSGALLSSNLTHSLANQNEAANSSNETLPTFETNAFDAAMSQFVNFGAQFSALKSQCEKLQSEKVDLEREKAILEGEVAELKTREAVLLEELDEEKAKSERAWWLHVEKMGTETAAKEEAQRSLEKEKCEREEEKIKIKEEIAKLKGERDRERSEYAVEITSMNALLNEEILKVARTSQANTCLQAKLEKEMSEVVNHKKTMEELWTSLEEEKSERLRERKEFVDERKKKHDEKIRETNELWDQIEKTSNKIRDEKNKWEEEVSRLKGELAAVTESMKSVQLDLQWEKSERAIEKKNAADSITRMENERIHAKAEYDAELLKLQTLLDEEKQKAYVKNKSNENMWRHIGVALGVGSSDNPEVVRGLNKGLHEQLSSRGRIASLEENIVEGGRAHSPAASHENPISPHIAESEVSFASSSDHDRAEKRKPAAESEEECKRKKTINTLAGANIQ